MVKFGRHLQFYLECEHPETTHYIVPYSTIRDDMNNKSTNTMVVTTTHSSDDNNDNGDDNFQTRWYTALQSASDDFRDSTRQVWRIMYDAISSIPQARGATLDVAVKLYASTSVVDISDSQDMLVSLKGIHSTACVNAEALRKLVKKFDKQQQQAHQQQQQQQNEPNYKPLSTVLLPELYTANFAIGQETLQSAISVLREELDEYSVSDGNDNNLVWGEEKKNEYSNSDQEREEDYMVGRRAEELAWLQNMVKQIPESDLKYAVAHRGFHNPYDKSDVRPLENSLQSFEVAWSNGIHLCECDVALTKDEKIVVVHDTDMMRLALDPSNDSSAKNISDLTFKELISLTLKNGVRAPLLLDTLRSAHEIGGNAQLVIEIKPGNIQVCGALTRLFTRHPELINQIAVIMSFDLWAMHKLREDLDALNISPSTLTHPDHNDPCLKHGSSYMEPCSSFSSTLQINMPKLMLLTVADPPDNNYELWVDIADYSPIDSWLTNNSTNKSLDGVYVKFQDDMLTEEGAAELKALSDKYVVGVWTKLGTDPDEYRVMKALAQECSISYFNTDLPRNFLTDD